MSSSNSNPSTESDPPAKKKRTGWGWARMGCFTLLILLLIVGAVGYFFASGFAKNKISDQLSQLGLGDADVGSVAILPDGISASDISFPETDGVSLSVGSLRIHHPISGLVAGDETFNAIEISDASAVLDASKFAGGDTAFDLSSLSEVALPTKDLTVKNASVKLVDGDREANIDKINLNIIDGDGLIKFDGSTGEILGAQWKIDGQFDREQAKATVKLAADEGRVLSEDVVNLPLIPQSISNAIKNNVEFEVAYSATEATIVAEGAETPQLSVQTAIDQSSLRLPAFDLPIQINSANVDLNNTEINVNDLSATTCTGSPTNPAGDNGCDLITGKAQIRFTEDPINIDFQTEFEQVDTATLRKIVTALPVEVTGTADGTANGTVLVNADSSIDISIDADAQTENGSYGELLAEAADIDVRIQSLKFDQNIKYESIAGGIQVTGNAKQQPIAKLFDTFDLAALNQQLELAADYDAKFDLKLPLATVENLATWELTATAQAPTASLSTAKLSDIDVETSLRGGNLKISRLTAVATPDVADAVSDQAAGDVQKPANLINGSLEWPIVKAESLPTTGKIQVAGQGVALNWLLQLGQRQLEILNADTDADPNVDPNADPSLKSKPAFDVSDLRDRNINGQINFGVDWSLPVATPDDLELWDIAIKVDDSKINADEESLENLTATASLRGGQFDVTSLEGNFSSGGRISEGRVSYDVSEEKLDAAALTTRNVPLSWLVKLGIQNVPAASDWAKANPDIAEQLESIDGNLSLSVTADQENPLEQFQINAVSKSVIYKDLRVADIIVETKVSASKVEISQVKATVSEVPNPDEPLPEETPVVGSLKASGQWSLTEEPSGELKLVARQLPIQLLGQVADVGGLPSGTVGGTFLVSQQPQPGTNFPVSVRGVVNTREISLASYRLQPLDFDVATNQNGLSLNSKPNNLLNGLKLNAEVGDDFKEINANLKLKRFGLETLFDEASVLDATDEEMVTVSGVADGEANLRLSLETNQWTSKGDLSVTQPFLNQVPLTDFDAKWEHSPADVENTMLKVDMFGGEFDLVRLSENATQADFELKDVDLKQLALLVPQKVRATGTLSGTLKINGDATALPQDDAQNEVAKQNQKLQAPVQAQDQVKAQDKNADQNPPLGSGISVVLKLQGENVSVEQLVLGQADAEIKLIDGTLTYSAESQLLDGKLAANGKTTLDYLFSDKPEADLDSPKKRIADVEDLLSDAAKNAFDEKNIAKSLTVTLTQGSLGTAIRQVAKAQQLKQVQGNISAKLEIGLSDEGQLVALGDVNVGDVRYQNKLLTKQVTSRVKIDEGVMQIDQLQVDLVRGKIAGSIRVPLDLSKQGSFQLNISQLDLSRLNELILRDKQTGLGVVNGRISGTVGPQISGVATFDVSQSKLLGAKSSQLRLPIRFLVRTKSGSGQIELTRTRQQILGGTVAGKAKLTFGDSIDVDTDLELSRIDTALLTSAFTSTSADGSLSGTLKLAGNRIRSPRDLKGVFRGTLEQAQAFELPILDQLSRFSPGAQLQSGDFSSQEILVRLQKGQIEIERFNIGSSLASIAVSGKAGLDGRLDLEVIARIERFNQVALVDELAGSQLVRLSGTPVAFFAQAADFLSDRLLFLKVRGTIARPLIVPDSGRQLREELIRYFLRGSQILPIGVNLNN